MTKPPTLRRILSALGLSVILLGPGQAAGTGLPEPRDEVILTVTGAVAIKNSADAARFDRTMLEDLPRTGFATTTIWSEGQSRFTGVLLQDLLAAVGAEGKMLKAIALNDYAVEIPVADETTASAIIAYEIDGQAMSVRDKGPLWIVYPYQSAARFRTETVYSRSIWQLSHIEVID